MFFLALVTVVSLCGCSSVLKEDRNITVSALGFDKEGDNYLLSVEVIIINSENNDDEPKPQVLIGKGENIKSAFKEISNYLPWNLLISHCGVIVIGKTIDKTSLENICKYLLSNRIPLASYLIATENSSELLKGGSEISAAAGYELMEKARHKIENQDKFNSSFFQIEKEILEKNQTLELPCFIRKNNNLFYKGITEIKVADYGNLS